MGIRYKSVLQGKFRKLYPFQIITYVRACVRVCVCVCVCVTLDAMLYALINLNCPTPGPVVQSVALQIQGSRV